MLTFGPGAYMGLCLICQQRNTTLIYHLHQPGSHQSDLHNMSQLEGQPEFLVTRDSGPFLTDNWFQKHDTSQVFSPVFSGFFLYIFLPSRHFCLSKFNLIGLWWTGSPNSDSGLTTSSLLTGSWPIIQILQITTRGYGSAIICYTLRTLEWVTRVEGEAALARPLSRFK